MKMQDVITKLREEAPFLSRYSKSVDEAYQRVRGLMDDFRSAKSDEGRKALADAISDEMNVLGTEYRTLRCSIETVCLVNAEYKEKIGPRTKKPKDAEGQQMLPGLEADGGTPTTMGGTPTTMGGTPTTMGGTPTTMGGTPADMGRTPSFMQSGRHG